MHILNIRGIDDTLYNKIKKESKSKGLSINKFLVNILSGFFNKKKNVEYHDLDDFFGTWTEEEYNQITLAAKESRTIDEEVWDKKL